MDAQLQLRVGLNSGEMIVRSVGNDYHMEISVTGDTASVGKRVESAAEKGTVYLSENVYQAINPYFNCLFEGEHKIKGKEKPIMLYRAINEKQIRTRIQASAELGLTPYIGRQKELDVLKTYFERVVEGQGQIVAITGEAGIGKSRLIVELKQAINHEGLLWAEGQCYPAGKNIAFHPLIDMLKKNFGIEDSDDEAKIIDRLNEATGTWDASMRKTLPFLKYLLSVDPGVQALATMDPQLRRAGILDGLRAWLLQTCTDKPLVVVIEDLHWIDEQSEDILASLIDLAASNRVFFVFTSRPDYSHNLAKATSYNRLVLENLNIKDSTALIEGILEVQKFPKELGELINEKTEGNPFYLEEVTRSLVEQEILLKTNGTYTLERPIEDVHIPGTIQKVILSRIDRLEQQVKMALQLASVIGREFAKRILARISEPGQELDPILNELRTLEMILQKAYFPEAAFMFKHALTHDLAYSTLLSRRRKALHKIIGAALEETYADRLSEHYEIIAHHYSEGDSKEKALEYLVKAGDKAAAAYANKDALAYYARALDVCDKIGKPVLERSLKLAQQRGWLNFSIMDCPSAIADFDRMHAYASQLQDKRLQGLAIAYRGWAEGWNHEFEKAEETSRAALALAGDEYEDVQLFASITLGLFLYAIHRVEEAKPFLDATIDLAERVNDPISHFWWSIVGWHRLAWESRFEDTLDHLERWRGTIEQSGNVFGLLGDRWLQAIVLGGKGNYTHALSNLYEVLETGERVGDVFWVTRTLNTLGWIYGELQDIPSAMKWNTRGIEAAVEANFPDPEVESNARLNLGDNLMALGRLDEAEEQFKIVERISRNPKPEDRLDLWRYSQHMFHSYGELWLLRGDTSQAIAYADECLRLAEPANSQKNITKARRLRGEAFMAMDDLVNAEKELSTALDIAQQIANPPQLWKTLVAQGQLFLAQGSDSDALVSFKSAYAVIKKVAASLEDTSLRETFLSSEHAQHIAKLAQQ